MISGTPYLATASKKVHDRYCRIPDPTPELPPMGQKSHTSGLPDQNDPNFIPKLFSTIGSLTQEVETLKKGQNEKIGKKQYNRDMTEIADNFSGINQRQAKINHALGRTQVTATKALLGAKKAITTGQINMALNLKTQEENLQVKGVMSALNIPKTVYLTNHLQLIHNLDAQINEIENDPDKFIRSLEHLDNDPAPQENDLFVPVDIPSLRPNPPELTIGCLLYTSPSPRDRG